MAASVVEIRPGVNILGVLQHLEYKPWYALAEYVDNSIQSFITSKKDMPDQGRVTVDIEIDRDGKSIIITDNAAGICLDDFPRAFRPAEVPANTAGLSEFGMGMKSASCWFSPNWSVRTSAFGDPVERTVHFDMKSILSNSIEQLDIVETTADPESHFTEITLRSVYQLPQGRTLGKIRDHLSDIYRCFLRDGLLRLRVAEDQFLDYYEPDALMAPAFNAQNEPHGDPVRWQKDIAFELEDGRIVCGQAGILSRGDTKRAGLSLYRRRRAIVGSGDEKYRPQEIFGAGNSYESQRVWGELHMDEFSVSHTKDGFQWRDTEEEFLIALRAALDSDDMPLLRQARNYRSGRPTKNNSGAITAAVDNVVGALESSGADDIGDIISNPDVGEEAPTTLNPTESEALESRTFTIAAAGEQWAVQIELASEPGAINWLEIATDHDTAQRTQQLHLRVHTTSPFMRKIVRLDELDSVEPVLRLAAAIGLSELLARLSGVSANAGELRRTINSLLGSSLSLRHNEKTPANQLEQ